VSTKHLNCNPQHVINHDDWWWYEEPDGFTIVVEPDKNGHTRVVRVPWARIRAALKRKDRKP